MLKTVIKLGGPGAAKLQNWLGCRLKGHRWVLVKYVYNPPAVYVKCEVCGLYVETQHPVFKGGHDGGWDGGGDSGRNEGGGQNPHYPRPPDSLPTVRAVNH